MTPIELFLYFVAVAAGIVVLGVAGLFVALVYLAVRGSLERVRR